MDIKQTYERVPAIWKKIAAVVGFCSALGGVYAAANTFMGVEIRPAWAWEVQELNRDQLRTSLELQRINRRDAQRQLNEYRSMREDMRRNGEPVPSWLIKEISDGEEDVLRFDDRIKAIQDRLVK